MVRVEDPVPPPPPPPSSSSPHAPTPKASAASRQPYAANERDLKEPLLRSRYWAAILRTPLLRRREDARNVGGMMRRGAPQSARNRVLAGPAVGIAVAREVAPDEPHGGGEQDHDDGDHE